MAALFLFTELAREEFELHANYNPTGAVLTEELQLDSASLNCEMLERVRVRACVSRQL